jgi:hypothetical protein
VKRLQYHAETIREVFLDKATCPASLSDIDNNVRDARELLHDRIPFFVVLLYFLIYQTLLIPEMYRKTSQKRTPRILSA